MLFFIYLMNSIVFSLLLLIVDKRKDSANCRSLSEMKIKKRLTKILRSFNLRNFHFARKFLNPYLFHMRIRYVLIKKKISHDLIYKKFSMGSEYLSFATFVIVIEQ